MAIIARFASVRPGSCPLSRKRASGPCTRTLTRLRRLPSSDYKKSPCCRSSRAGGNETFARRAVRRRARRRTWATSSTRTPSATSTSEYSRTPSGPASSRARNDMRRARRRARSSSWARLIPGQQAATSAATGGGSDSGAQPAGSGRATSSKRTAIWWGDAVLTCREDPATCPSWHQSRCAANPWRSQRLTTRCPSQPPPERRGTPLEGATGSSFP